MPRTISTSGILSTGEKKCRPRKLVGSTHAFAIEVIGSDEVFEASSASGPTIAATLANVCFFSARSSKTASMTRSQPASVAAPPVAVIRAR